MSTKTNCEALTVVSDISVTLMELHETDFVRCCVKSLSILANAVGSERVTIWRNFKNDGGKLSAMKISEYVKDSDIFRPSAPVIGYSDGILPIDEPVSDLECRRIDPSELHESLKKHLLLENSSYFLVSPIVFRGNFWGFITYAFENEPKSVSCDHENLLRVAGMMIATGIIRNEISNNLILAEIKAATDDLTSLPNRGSFIMRADGIFARHVTKGESLSLLFIDIDYFKYVNDRYGHQFGDEVLIAVGSALRDSIRPSDLVCRYGGEEFLLLLSNADEATAYAAAERVTEEIKNLYFAKHPDFRFSVSIGVVSDVPKSEQSLDDFIRMSDIALYEAKNAGRRQIVVYNKIFEKRKSTEI